jgi:hypothetical protein
MKINYPEFGQLERYVYQIVLINSLLRRVSSNLYGVHNMKKICKRVDELASYVDRVMFR